MARRAVTAVPNLNKYRAHFLTATIQPNDPNTSRDECDRVAIELTDWLIAHQWSGVVALHNSDTGSETADA